MTDPAKTAEALDAVRHLAAHGFADLLRALQQDRVYTHGGEGRLNLAALARTMRISQRRAAALIRAAREALA